MVAFSVLGYSVYWYGIFYFVSFIFVYFFLKHLATFAFLDMFPRLKEVLATETEDILLYAVGGVLLGGRLGYILIYDLAYYVAHPLKVFALHEGGMAFIGGIIGVIVAVLIFRKVKKLSWKEFWVLFDGVVVIVPLAIILGRLGNYLNQEIYGIVVDTDILTSSFGTFLSTLNIIHVYPRIDDLPRFNTNLIAMIFEGGIIFIVMLGLCIQRLKYWVKNDKIFPGVLSGVFLVLYSFFRFFIEYLRQDSQAEFVYGLTKSQWFFVVFFVLGIMVIWRSKRR
ncbi:MAG: prolipoprotein diacylglyceryl transferase [candidate division SR1 bacterium]|nr:MAG: prolipoprotein diacylglyceryl transferase [candidate division SR1 bacterium]